MGDVQSSIAVADAGPLIHLGQIGALPLLSVFTQVHVSYGVWAETVGAGRVAGHDLENAVPLRRHEIDPASLQRFVEQRALSALHPGETEALLLCRQLAAPVLLADDLAARDAAWRQGVRPVGSLGIVVRACHVGRLSTEEAEACIHRLHHVSSLFVTQTIADLAIGQLRPQ